MGAAGFAREHFGERALSMAGLSKTVLWPSDRTGACCRGSIRGAALATGYRGE
jgi:hypothetical protein